MKKFFATIATTALMFCIGIAQATGIPQLKTPILLTSLGQAADAHTMSVLAKRAKVPMDFKTFANGTDVSKYKTMFVCVGVSLKGFGSAGVNLDTETARANDIFKSAKASGTYTILVHIGGSERRDQMSNKMLEIAMPHADAYIVYDQANADGYFTKSAGSKPLVLLPKTMKMINLLKELK